MSETTSSAVATNQVQSGAERPHSAPTQSDEPVIPQPEVVQRPTEAKLPPITEILQPETKSWFDHHDITRLRTETDKDGNIFLSIDIKPPRTPEQLASLKATEPLPFKIMMKIDDQIKYQLQSVIENTTFMHGDAANLNTEIKYNYHQKMLEQFFTQNNLAERISKARVNLFFHGFAGNAEVWDPKFLQQNLLNQPQDDDVINIIPSAMGMGNEQQKPYTEKIDGIEQFNPEMYGQQMCAFIDQFVGWNKYIQLHGHSMGGIGVLHVATEIVRNSKYRDQNGNPPQMDIFSYAPAYPPEAQSFLLNYKGGLQQVFKLLRQPGIKQASRIKLLAPQISQLINKTLIPKSKRAQEIHAENALAFQDQLYFCMNGLLFQKELSPTELAFAEKLFNICIFTSPTDGVVSQDQWNIAFNKIKKEMNNLLHQINDLDTNDKKIAFIRSLKPMINIPDDILLEIISDKKSYEVVEIDEGDFAQANDHYLTSMHTGDIELKSGETIRSLGILIPELLSHLRHKTQKAAQLHTQIQQLQQDLREGISNLIANYPAALPARHTVPTSEFGQPLPTAA